MTITVELSLPSAPLKANYRSRSHWPRTRAIKAHRAEAKVAGKQALHRGTPPMWDFATITPTFHHRNRRGMADPDNLVASLKAAIDGLRDAKILADDRHVTIAAPVQCVDAKRPRLTLAVEGA